MRILMITYRFAPSARVGAKRMSALSYYFSKSGICCDIDVVAPKISYIQYLDQTIQHGARAVYRTKMHFAPYAATNHNIQILSIYRKVIRKIAERMYEVDPWQGGNRHIIRQCQTMLETNSYDLIIATGPPFSCFLAAEEISDRYRIPLILDYRDPWTAYPWSYKSVSEGQRAHEKRIASKADGVVFCAEGIREGFIDNFAEISKAHIAVITNGYYPYTGDRICPEDGCLNIAHAGSLYGQRSLSILIEPIRIVKGLYSKPIRLHHWGSQIPGEIEIFAKEDMSNVLRHHPRVTRSELIQYLGGADLLFLSSGSDVNYAIPYKTFDYISTGNPILAVTPKDTALYEFIKSNYLGCAADMHAPLSIAEGISKCISLARRKPPIQFSWEHIAEHYLAFLVDTINT